MLQVRNEDEIKQYIREAEARIELGMFLLILLEKWQICLLSLKNK